MPEHPTSAVTANVTKKAHKYVTAVANGLKDTLQEAPVFTGTTGTCVWPAPSGRPLDEAAAPCGDNADPLPITTGDFFSSSASDAMMDGVWMGGEST